MKITPEISALVEKNRYFFKPETCNVLLDLLRGKNKVSVVRTGGSARKSVFQHFHTYNTGRSQHNTDFAKTNQNEVMRICTNFFEHFRIRKLIHENKFVILNL